MICLNATSNTGGIDGVPGWSFTWQGNGRFLKVSVQITCQTSTYNTVAQWYLCRRTVGSPYDDIVAVGTHFLIILICI